MPEIEIRRSRRPAISTWAWVIGGIVLAAMLWWIIAASLERARRSQQAAVEPIAVGWQNPPHAIQPNWDVF